METENPQLNEVPFLSLNLCPWLITLSKVINLPAPRSRKYIKVDLRGAPLSRPQIDSSQGDSSEHVISLSDAIWSGSHCIVIKRNMVRVTLYCEKEKRVVKYWDWTDNEESLSGKLFLYRRTTACNIAFSYDPRKKFWIILQLCRIMFNWTAERPDVTRINFLDENSQKFKKVSGRRDTSAYRVNFL